MGGKGSGKTPRTLVEFDADFAARVDVNGPTAGHMATPCHVWCGGRNKAGYGTVDFGGKTQLAHRAAWMRANEGIPEGLNVLHKCDNRACVRLDHLYVGTQQRNIQDMIDRGRLNVSKLVCPPEKRERGDQHFKRRHPELVPRGEKQGNAKLTEADIVEIRRLYDGGMYQKDIAKKFGIVQPHVSRLVRGESWKHVE